MKKPQNHSKKGFTLVELIVVMVILAILAALLVPSLSGYIDKAKEKRVVTEVHQVVVAAQTLADEVYALSDNPNYGTIELSDIKELAEIKGDIEKIVIDTGNGKILYAAVTRSSITGYYSSEEDSVLTAPADEASPVAIPEGTGTSYALTESGDEG